MRGSICVERGGCLYRLVWLSESRAGLYYGQLGSDRDHHVSYHTDGIRHFRSGDSTYHEFLDVALAESRGIRQLLSANVALSLEWLNATTSYVASRVGETRVVLPEEQLVDCDSLLIDHYLMDQPSEGDFRAFAARVPRPGLSLLHLRT